MNLNQVSLPAIDLAESVAFYERLGLTLIVITEAYGRLELPDGGRPCRSSCVKGEGQAMMRVFTSISNALTSTSAVRR